MSKSHIIAKKDILKMKYNCTCVADDFNIFLITSESVSHTLMAVMAPFIFPVLGVRSITEYSIIIFSEKARKKGSWKNSYYLV